MPVPSVFLAAVLSLAVTTAACASPMRPAVPACTSPDQPIHEHAFVPIGGIEQWVTIDGDACSNPVILFLHGGPGNPLSPYADTVYGDWAHTFTLVQWDQRGAGRTYGRNTPDENAMLTIEQMTADGIALAEHLTRRLGQRKLILFGSSWGSALGVHMAKARPDLFHAYVGAAQIVNMDDDVAASHAAVLARARAAGDRATVSALDALGTPPWTNPRNFGVLRRAIRAYEAKATTPAPAHYWVPATEYATPERQAEYAGGEDYSFLQFVGFHGDGIASKLDLPALGTTFELPVFIIQGAEDLLTMPAGTRRYFDAIVAPHKDYVVVANAGHDPNPPLVEAEYAVLNDKVRALIE